ncbi:hypothetical protein RSSM_04533 [Rhodopirellula sallentina SM41]|uniref:Uncharacterized protein n=1 Tax=Rhodopirellula sallentina SM41 TaxID=1263870 RepID=M5TXT2_9BACT|nr:hypothetical protein RSSM_04533 [Rhodopirellula sallentina SM41]
MVSVLEKPSYAVSRMAVRPRVGALSGLFNRPAENPSAYALRLTFLVECT